MVFNFMKVVKITYKDKVVENEDKVLNLNINDH